MVQERKGHGNFKSILIYLLPQENEKLWGITDYRGKGNTYLECESLYIIILVCKDSVTMLSCVREMKEK